MRITYTSNSYEIYKPEMINGKDWKDNAAIVFVFALFILPCVIGFTIAYAEGNGLSLGGLIYAPNNEAIAHEILLETNALRVSVGVAPLEENINMNIYAADYSKKLYDMCNPYLAASDEEFNKHFVHSFGPYGENIAMNYNLIWGSDEEIAKRMMYQWEHSAGHYANMVNPDYTTIGVGVYCNKYGGCYATQEFNIY